MNFHIISLFPEIFNDFLGTSLIKKAQETNSIRVELSNLRNFAEPPHFRVDDIPYGGGAGMVLKPEPIAKAVRDAKLKLKQAKVISFSPSGKPFNQAEAEKLSKIDEVILLCGRYEGIDQRATESYIDQEYSVGDYILMGGEIPAMILIEATARLIPGVLGNETSTENESFSPSNHGLLEAPHFTRPAEFEGKHVPEVLLSGNHAQIEKWRKEKSLEITKRIRPDLLSRE